MPDNNWTLISGSTPQDYTDTAVFEVNPDTKQIALITGQALVAGEKDSQYISFLMPRYWDGIDISDKTFTIEYALAGTYYGTSEAVNAEMTTEQVRFGWIVPEEACAISGTLLFVLKITSEDYVLKTQIAEHPVFKTIRVEDVVPEPTKEAWYIEFQNRVDGAISEAEAAVDTAQATLTDVEAAAQLAQTASQEAQGAQGAVEAASQSAQTSAQVAQVSQEAAEAAAQTASAKASEASQSAQVAQVSQEAAEAAAQTASAKASEASQSAQDAKNYAAAIGTPDTTLTISGKAADAKATGDEIGELKSGLMQSGVTDEGGWKKFSDGVLIQYGAIHVKAGSFTAAQAFPVPFVNREKISVQVTPLQSGTDWNINYANLSTTTLSIGRTPNTALNDYYYIAIGRWK